MLLFAWGFNYTVDHQVIPKMQFDNKVLQIDIQKLTTDLASNIEHNYRIFGAVYAALGVLAVGGAILIDRSGKKSAAANSTPQSSSDTGATQAEPAYKTSQKPKRQPPKIQG